MKIRMLLVGVGLFALGTGTAFAQAGPAVAGPQGPNAGSVANSTREQMQGYNHVVSNIEGQQPSNQESGTSGAVRKVTAADVAVGAALRDVNGKPIGKIASVDADGVVVDSGAEKVKVPVAAFGMDKKGLLLGITAQRFNELAAKAHAQNVAAAPAKPEPRPATLADISAGASLRDVDGKQVGKITFVAADGATIDTGQTKVKLPIDSFGVDTAGLVLPITLQKLNELIAQSRAAATAKK